MERNLLLKETGSVVLEQESSLFSFNPDPVISNAGRRWLEQREPAYEVLLLSPGVLLPKKLQGDGDKNTCYLEIDLKLGKDLCYTGAWVDDAATKRRKFVCNGNINGTVEKKTAVFAPSYFSLERSADIIVYLHGHLKDIPGIDGKSKSIVSPDIQKYLNCCKSLFLRQAITDSKKNMILIAPTLGPLSQPGNLVKNFDQYIEQCLAAINEYIIKGRGLKGKLDLGRLVIAAHSGGGALMQAIALSSQKYAKRVDEFWGLDSWYQTANSWIQFAKNNSGKKILGCYSTSERNNHLSGRTGLILDRSNKNIPANLVVRKGDPNSHFGLVIPCLKELLTGAPAPKTSTTQTNSSPKANVPVIAAHGSFKTTQFSLSNTPITIVKGNRVKKMAEIKEAPSVFLKKIIEMALGKQTSEEWFSQFTRVSFLGRELHKGQYVHLHLAKHLKQVETELSKKYGGPKADPVVAGDYLLGTERENLAGSRIVSGTATYSYHMFGLAIDVNYTGNPFVQNKERKGKNKKRKEVFTIPNGKLTMNETLSNAHDLMGGNKARFEYGLTYDQYASINKYLVGYLTLSNPENEQKLRTLLNTSGNAKWKMLDLEEARKKIQADSDKLAFSLDRWTKREQFKRKGFLNVSKEFVEGVKLNWGSWYGDMMHFDMRSTGVGVKIEQAKNAYIKQKSEESRKRYLAK